MKKQYRVKYTVKDNNGKTKKSGVWNLFAENLNTVSRLANRMKYALFNKDKTRVTIDKISKI